MARIDAALQQPSPGSLSVEPYALIGELIPSFNRALSRLICVHPVIPTHDQMLSKLTSDEVLNAHVATAFEQVA